MLAPIDVEAATVAYLAARLAVPVATTAPTPRPPSHVRVTKTGGTTGTLVSTNLTLLVECWGPGEVAAFALARSVYGHLSMVRLSRMDGHVVYRVELGEPVNYPDPDAVPASRYQFVAQLTMRLDITASA